MSSPHESPTDDDRPLSDVAPVGFDLSLLMAGYPGPILVTDSDDRIITANARAQSLLDEDKGKDGGKDGDGGWWRSLAAWRGSARWEEGGPQDEHMMPFERRTGTVVIGWKAVRLGPHHLLVIGRDATPEHRLRQRLHSTTQNATMELHLRETLAESRQRYKDLVEISSDFAWETGADGCFVFVSPRGALGYGADALVNHHPRLMALEGDDEDDMPLPFESRQPIDAVELWVRAADGSPACLAVSVKPLFDQRGTWVGARGVCRNLTEQVQRTGELARIRHRERVLDRIVHALRDHTDADRTFALVAAEATHALDAAGCGIYRTGATGAPEQVVVFGDSPPSPTGGWLAELLQGPADLNRPRDWSGNGMSLLACPTTIRSTVNGVVAIWRAAGDEPWDDESRLLLCGVAERIGVALAQIVYQERLRQLSERDGLTGLFNRRTFLERLGEMLDQRDHGTSALLYIDLDNFKAVNDLRGHQQGDAVLKAVTVLIASGCRPGDIAGRLGGDEFVLWLARTGAEGAATVAHRLLDGLTGLRPLSASDDRPLGLSIGIAVHDRSRNETLSALLERADTAMYQAKTHGKNSFALAPPLASLSVDTGVQESRS